MLSFVFRTPAVLTLDVETLVLARLFYLVSRDLRCRVFSERASQGY